MMAGYMAGWSSGNKGQSSQMALVKEHQLQKLVKVLMSDVHRLNQELGEQRGLRAKAQQFAAEQQLSADKYRAQIANLVAASVMQQDELRKAKLNLRAAKQAHTSQRSELTKVLESLAAHKAYVAELEVALRTTEKERDAMAELAAVNESDYERVQEQLQRAFDSFDNCQQQLTDMTERCEAAEAAKKAAEEAQRQAEQALAELVNSRHYTSPTTAADTAATSSDEASELSAALAAAREQHAACLDSLSLVAATAQQAAVQAVKATTMQQSKAAVGVTASLLQELMQQLQSECNALQQVAMPHCSSLLSSAHAAVAASQQQMDVLAVPSLLCAVQTASSSSLSSCDSTELVLQPATPPVCSLDGEDSPSSSTSSMFMVEDELLEEADQDAEDDDVCSICSDSVAVVDEVDDSDVSSSSAQLQQQDQQQHPARIVLYRTTYYQDHNLVSRVNSVKLVLAMMKVDYEEVDVGLQPEYLADMKSGMVDCDVEVVYPQVHVNGKFVGSAEELGNLCEYGILPRILQGVSVQQAMADLEAADYEQWLEYEVAKDLANADPAVSN